MHHAKPSLVDRLVDSDYLATCAAAWRITSEHARSILDQLDSEQIEPHDDHHRHCINWLRRAAVYRMDLAETVPYRPHTGEMAPTVAMLQHAADNYLPLLQGKTNGQAVLLAGDGLPLWYDYFQTRNRPYGPLNTVAATTAFEVLRAVNGTRVLELGAGTGGTTGELVTTWPDDLDGAYTLTVTDTSARLLMTTHRNLEEHAPANVSLEFRRLDFNSPAATQGIPPDSYDVVVAANALHNATDIAATLRDLTPLVRTGGALVLSESLCAPGDLVHQEFILNLLPLPTDAYRRRSRFFAKADWQARFEAAGVHADLHVNTTGSELVLVAVASPRQHAGAP